MTRLIKHGILILFLTAPLFSNGQKISVSPTRLYFDLAPGKFQTKKVRIQNNSNKKLQFEMTFGDFHPDVGGKLTFADDAVYSCKEWLTATPSFLELEPGQGEDVNVLLQVPDGEENALVKWSMMFAKVVEERGNLDPDKNGFNARLNETVRFGVYIFQTPPNISFSRGEIISFESDKDSILPSEIVMTVKNVGETILYCNTYLEFTNLNTGDEQRIEAKKFTLLPNGNIRKVNVPVPVNLDKGQYSVLGILDFGDKTEILAAELDLTVN